LFRDTKKLTVFLRLERDGGINIDRMGYRRRVSVLFGKENMKHFSKHLSGICLGLTLFFSAVPGHGQDSDRVRVAIPFNFSVGDKQLKAGDYVIESLPDKRALILRSRSGDVQQIAFTVPIETKSTGTHEHLLFHHDGDQYFLSQVWFSGDENARELIPVVHEKSMAKGRPAGDQAIVGQ
jgi:hypothetical protein